LNYIAKRVIKKLSLFLGLELHENV